MSPIAMFGSRVFRKIIVLVIVAGFGVVGCYAIPSSPASAPEPPPSTTVPADNQSADDQVVLNTTDNLVVVPYVVISDSLPSDTWILVSRSELLSESASDSQSAAATGAVLMSLEMITQAQVTSSALALVSEDLARAKELNSWSVEIDQPIKVSKKDMIILSEPDSFTAEGVSFPLIEYGTSTLRFVPWENCPECDGLDECKVSEEWWWCLYCLLNPECLQE